MSIAKTGFAGAISAAVSSTLRGLVAPSPGSPLPEHSLVKALCEIREGDVSVPVGATGTVVSVIRGGVGYQVEFTAPEHIVISAERSELTPA